MRASEIRSEARQRLAGKWGKAAVLSLVFTVVTYIISFVLNLVPIVGYLVTVVISVPLSYGFMISMVKLNDNNEVTSTEFLNNGFANFSKAWSVSLNTLLKLILPIILVIISAVIFGVASSSENIVFLLLGFALYIAALLYSVIKQLSYSLALYVLYDNPEMTGKEAVNKSAELMEGKVWSLFCLNLSFFGWALLAVFTFGIGMFWLLPYMRLSEINFYRNLTGEVNSAE